MKIIIIEDTKEDMEPIKNMVEKFHEVTPLYQLQNFISQRKRLIQLF